MKINRIERDDVEELFVLFSVLIMARGCDNSVALEIEKKLIEKFKNIVGFSNKDVEVVERIIREYDDKITALKKIKEENENKDSQKISLEERMEIFWGIICKKQKG